MHRYLAITYDWNDPASIRQANALTALCRHAMPTTWTCELSTLGLVVFGLRSERAEMHAHLLPEKSGVILGTLFSTKTSRPSSVMNNESVSQQTAIAETGGRKLVDEFWGNYVAFLVDYKNERRVVIRDCSGKVPCYRVTHQKVDIFFSDISDTTALELPTFSIDWQYVAAFLYYNDLQVRTCGLREVTELLAGDCLVLQTSSESHFPIWDPRAFCRLAPLDDYGSAKAELSRATQNCIDSWATIYTNILHCLSGGFDSSVVLGCVSRSPARPTVTCLNRYNDHAGEDERAYARSAARRAGVTLIEQSWGESMERFDEGLLTAPLTAKPSVPVCINLANVRLRNSIAKQTGATAIWTGQGGDHLFFQSVAPFGAIDYVHSHGFGLGFPTAMAEAAPPFRDSLTWAILRSAFSSAVHSTPWRPPSSFRRNPPFVCREALPSSPNDYIAHPWTKDMDDLSQGKQCHVTMVANVVNRHRPLPTIELAAEHHPLLSQPIMELCLRIPTYLHLKGGRDRALARDCFSDRIPPEIAQRQSKGASTSSRLAELQRSKAFVRDLLLQGSLVREGLIKRDAIAPYVVQDAPLRSDQYFPLMACLAAEVWVRQWEAKPLAGTKARTTIALS